MWKSNVKFVVIHEIKQERLDALKAKVPDLEIWEGVEIRKSSYRTKFVNGALMSSPIIMGEYLIYKLGKWVYERMAYGDKKEEEIPLSPFPIDDPVVTHFHPVAFVEQMRRITEREAPWMEFLFQEYAKYKGINEDQSPLKERIKNHYHMSTTYAPAHKGTSNEWNHATAWCVSFVNWCFNQVDEYKNINSKGNGAAFDWTPLGSTKTNIKKGVDGWADGEECEAFVGAVITLSYSHTAFITGKNSKLNKYVYIGGNQGSGKSGTQQIKYGTVSIGKEFSIMKPKKYKIQSFDLPEIEQDADGNYKSTR
ncbi:hypothetical protein BZG01_19775 [Labilibaculum manganireducens]|uniref:Peptidase C51 domain-containing protein n=1 Tax=Labilibaculum manganireducens TaxID=1940525 RepID=A0A2N3HT09_9BACT|nr:hypothetical protein [Labilibaculum manganireducens]PKQ61190.1 hypothetical protein BZG01_19775 [Labilibaculum manganireducens]